VLFALSTIACGVEAVVDPKPLPIQEQPDVEPKVTLYKGALATTDSTGVVKVWIAGEITAPAAVPYAFHTESSLDATSTVQMTGEIAITLQGTYNPLTGVLTLAGHGYAIAATITTEGATGSISGPDNLSAKFSALPEVQGAATTIRDFCGVWAGGGSSGAWTMILSTKTGLIVGATAQGMLSGSLVGTNITLVGYFGTGAGTLSGSQASGTWQTANDAENQAVGTWSGSEGACG
jgi:hypothetical protein